MWQHAYFVIVARDTPVLGLLVASIAANPKFAQACRQSDCKLWVQAAMES